MAYRIAGLMTAALLGAQCVTAFAALPALTEAQVQAAAAKKVQADADAAAAKDALLASMDGLSARWRGNAASHSWKTYPPVPIAAPVAAVSAPTTQALTPPQVDNSKKPPPDPVKR